MCWEQVTHNMACDGRPLMTDMADEDCKSLIVNPFAAPMPCDMIACPGNIHPEHPAAPEVDNSNPNLVACTWHACCRIEITDLACSCCPTLRDIIDCVHFTAYHSYNYTTRYTVKGGRLSSGSRRGRSIPNDGHGWAIAEVPDRAATSSGTAPQETLVFGVVRRNLFALGSRLLAARRVSSAAQCAYAQSTSSDELIDRKRERWMEARQATRRLLASFDDALDIYFLMEEDGQGVIHAPFIERARKTKGAAPKPVSQEEMNSIREFIDGMKRLRVQDQSGSL